MKVLLLCSTPEYTGPAELMLEDARTLQEAGHEVTVAFDTRRDGSLRERVRAAALPVEETLDLCRQFHLGAVVSDVVQLRNALAHGVYDTLHARFANDHHAALLASLGARRRRLRVIRSTELLANLDKGPSRDLPYRLTDAFAVPSHEHRRRLEQVHQVPPERIHVLPGRVDADRFQPGPSGLRAELGIPADAPVVGIVSRIKPDRRHADLVRAFAQVLPLVPDAWLVLVGRGEGIPEVERVIEEEGVASRAVFAGYRTGDALVDAYRAFDVKAWIAPGNDGTCRAVLEAMACGSAVLGARFGAVAEAVVDGETGRLCDPDRPEDLARALHWLLSDRARARALGEAGRARAVASYTPARRAEALHRLYAGAWALPARASPLF